MLTGRITLTSHGVKIKGRMQISIKDKEIRIFNNRIRVFKLMLSQATLGLRENIETNYGKSSTDGRRHKELVVEY